MTIFTVGTHSPGKAPSAACSGSTATNLVSSMRPPTVSSNPSDRYKHTAPALLSSTCAGRCRASPLKCCRPVRENVFSWHAGVRSAHPAGLFSPNSTPSSAPAADCTKQNGRLTLRKSSLNPMPSAASPRADMSAVPTPRRRCPGSTATLDTSGRSATYRRVSRPVKPPGRWGSHSSQSRGGGGHTTSSC
jgi:hypothetical protein